MWMCWALPKHCKSGKRRLINRAPFIKKNICTHCYRVLATPNGCVLKFGALRCVDFLLIGYVCLPSTLTLYVVFHQIPFSSLHAPNPLVCFFPVLSQLTIHSSSRGGASESWPLWVFLEASPSSIRMGFLRGVRVVFKLRGGVGSLLFSHGFCFHGWPWGCFVRFVFFVLPFWALTGSLNLFWTFQPRNQDIFVKAVSSKLISKRERTNKQTNHKKDVKIEGQSLFLGLLEL